MVRKTVRAQRVGTPQIGKRAGAKPARKPASKPSRPAKSKKPLSRKPRVPPAWCFDAI